ncbi:MAG: DUF975 family protein [Christensenella sp.]|nr:DUF975 family protein [Christensenella sp.]
MRRARDFRETAWGTLRGRYWWAVLAALIASILGGSAGQNPISFRFNNFDVNQFSQNARQMMDGRFDSEAVATLIRPIASVVAALAGIAFVCAIGLFLVGSAVELGYNLFNLSLYESKSAPKIDSLFSRFSIFGNALLLRFLMTLKIFLWSLLFIVPGIVAAYRYAMAPYLLAEHPELTASEAIEQSKQKMAGNKGRLFCLQLSFIGWFLLAALTAGIGFIFLAPYTKAAETAFYLDLTGRLPLPQPAASPAPDAANPPASPVAPSLGEGESGGKEFI